MQLVSSNGNLSDEVPQEQVKEFLDSMQSVNLDEITTTTLSVAIREFRRIPLLDTDDNPLRDDAGQLRFKRVAQTRIAEIENYVPMRVFHRMLASRDKVMRERKRYLSDGGPSGEEGDPIIPWMTGQVLAVWQLSEPDMTIERLEDGLPFTHVTKLFSAFFGGLLQKQAK